MKKNRKKLSLFLVLALVVGTGVYGIMPSFANGNEPNKAESLANEQATPEDTNEEKTITNEGTEKVEQPQDPVESKKVEAKETLAAPLAATPGEAEAAEPDYSSATKIYLDGQHGDDNKDGLTKDSAVKSFDKAKGIVNENKNIKEIIILGTVEIAGDISLEGTNAKVIRDEDFKGYLFKVEANDEATLSNITIDGNKEKVQSYNSLFNVKGDLKITSGAVLTNNYSENNGGAITVDGGKIFMTNGEISYNKSDSFGGGIYATNSSIFMSGGKINNNYTNKYGGGILIDNGSNLDVKDAAIIDSNLANDSGGGISVGSSTFSDGSNILTMSGGTVARNGANGCGGGIFIQIRKWQFNSYADIYGGHIIDNIAGGSNDIQPFLPFAGGGIYVNGINKNFKGDWPNMGRVNGEDLNNGVLYLKNAIITKNDVVQKGGGIAGCPSSNITIYSNDGAAIYGNNPDPIDRVPAKDIYVSSYIQGAPIHNGNPTVNISDRMLGGLPYNWVEHNNHDSKYWKGTKLNDGQLRLENKNSYTDEQANKLGHVFITGNKSNTGGGGIGTNGDVIIGTPSPNATLDIKKTWDSKLTPEEVTVEAHFNLGKLIKDIEDELKAERLKQEGKEQPELTEAQKKAELAKIDHSNDYTIGKVVLNSENNYTGELEGLPSLIFGRDIEKYINLVENSTNKYVPKISKIENKSFLTFSVLRKLQSPNEVVPNAYRNEYMDYQGNFSNEYLTIKDQILENLNVTYNLADLNTGEIINSQVYNVQSNGEGWYKSAETITFKNIPVEGRKVEILYYDSKGYIIDPINPGECTPISNTLFEYNIFINEENGIVQLYVPYTKVQPFYQITVDEFPLMAGSALKLEDILNHKINPPMISTNLTTMIHNSPKPTPPRSPEPITVDPPVMKKVIGDRLDSKEPFKFKMKAVNKDNPMPEGSKDGEKIVTTYGAGKVEFGQFTYTKAGTYEYVISEIPQGNKEYTYDKTVYTIKDVVTAKNGKLQVERTITDQDGNKFEVATFTNEHKTPEQPKQPEKPQKPGVKTGDESGILAMIIVAGLAGMTVLAVRRRRDY